MANQFIAFNEGHFTLAADRLKCGNPQLLNASEHTDPSEAVIGAFGIPFDCGQFTNQGTSKAPGVVRELSNLYCSYQYPHDEIIQLFYQLSQTHMNFYGGEVVEVIPDLDTPTKTTCGMAANILRDMAILAWKAAKRR